LVTRVFAVSQAADRAVFNRILDRGGETELMGGGEALVEGRFVAVDLVEDQAPRLLRIEEHVEASATALALERSLTRNSTSTTSGVMTPPSKRDPDAKPRLF
jgi:hypothetical protein